MKKLLVVSGLMLTGLAGADVDYSRCVMAGSGMYGYGFSVDNDGNFQASPYQKVKSKSTEGKKETYVLESQGFMGGNTESTIILERDDQGRIIKMSTGGDKVDAKTIKQYKEMMVNSSLMSVGGFSGYGYGMGYGYYGAYNPYSQQGFMTQEPQFFVDGKMIPLSKLSKDQAKRAGFDGNIEQLQKLKSQWRKDKKAVKKLKDGYTQAFEASALVMPLGNEAEFEIKDGVCLVKNIAYKSYNTKTKEMMKTPGISREACEEVQKVSKKYQTKLAECAQTSNKAQMELWENTKSMQKGGMGVAGFYGGYPGGYAGGIAGGYVGGVNGGAYSLGDSYQCEMLYGVGPIQMGGGFVGGYTESKSGDSAAQKGSNQ